MKRIFKEWGGTIIIVIAVVALIGLVTLLMQPGGVLDGAFSSITRFFVEKTDSLVNADWKGLSVTLDNELSEEQDKPTLVDDATLTISGKITGAKGEASLTVNGTNVTVNEDGSWSASLTLVQGETTEVILSASDSQGNSTRKVVFINHVDYELVSLTGDYFDAIGYDTTVTDLVIPATFQKDDGTWCKITSIGEDAFKNHTNLKSVKIPEGVTYLGQFAFYGCTGLTSIGLPNSGAALELPASLTKINSNAFQACTGLTSVEFPRNVQYIFSQAFSECTNLSCVRFEEGSRLDTLREYAFSECLGITSVGPEGSGCDFEIPNSLTSLYRNVFSRDTNITKFIIPDSMTSLADDAFDMLTSLQAFEVSANHSSYAVVDGVLYTKDMKTLVRYPSGKTSSSFVVPASVTALGRYSFENGENLSSISLPSGLTTIGYYTFAYCYELESITIPGNVTYISSYVFYNCRNLDNAVFENTAGWSVSKNDVTTDVDVTDSAVNAQSLRRTYVYHTWSRE